VRLVTYTQVWIIDLDASKDEKTRLWANVNVPLVDSFGILENGGDG
jgi:hypothetical protein